MRVVDVSFSYDESLVTEEQLLMQHYTTEGWATALQRKSIEPIVAKRFSIESSLLTKKVQHYFVQDSFGGNLRPWQLPVKFLYSIKKLDADVVHVHGFMFPLQVLLLRLVLKKKTVIIIQHHGGKPPKGIKGFLYGLMNNMADSFFFTTTEQGLDWFWKKRNTKKVMPVMEGSNHFKYCKRSDARRISKLNGRQIFLWVGRLDNNKDPLTILNGFEALLKKHPTATLYMVYNQEELLEEVLKKINGAEALTNAVHLIGKINHDQLEAYYNSSDYFVLGSHYEGSGYALSEALACGCIPIVTDIPSFRMMTDNGKLGALWQVGNSQSFVEAANIAMNKSTEIESKNCVAFFNNNLSFNAIAEKAIEHYQAAIKKRRNN